MYLSQLLTAAGSIYRIRPIAQLHEKEEKQHDEIKEMKRQIGIGDDIIQKEDEDMGFTEVSLKIVERILT